MANTLDGNAKLWTLLTDDILSTTPVKLRSIFLIPGTEGDGINFYYRDPADAAHTAITGMNTTATTSRISDDDTGNLFASTTIGDWVYIHDTSSGNNQGIWRYVSAVDVSTDYIDVEVGTWGNLTAEGPGIVYNMEIYTPSLCIIMKTDIINSAGGTSKVMGRKDFGDKGRWFNNLGMTGFTSSSYIYVEIM